MGAATRELSITYGGVLIGGTSTNLLLTGRYRLTKGRDSAEIEFDFKVVESSEAAFALTVNTVEAVFRKPYQACVVALGAQTLERFSHTANTGFDAAPTLIKRGEDVADTGRSRMYTARIEFGMPANNTPTSGLRESTVEAIFSPSRRVEGVISGTYTAVGSTSARAKYNAGIVAFAASVQTALGVSLWELVEETAGPENTTNKTIEFERRYKEIIFGQAQDSVADDSTLTDQKLLISRRDQSGEDSIGNISGSMGNGAAAAQIGVRRLATIDLTYDVAVVSGTNPKTKYDAIRPWLIRQLKQTFPAGGLALIDERPELDRDDNRLRVTMTAVVVAGGATFLQRTLSVQDVNDLGKVFVPAWTGDPRSALLYQGPAVSRRIVRETYRKLGQVGAGEAIAKAENIGRALNARPAGAGGGVWETIKTDGTVTPVTLGTLPNQIEATDVTAIVERRYYVRLATGPSDTRDLLPQPPIRAAVTPD